VIANDITHLCITLDKYAMAHYIAFMSSKKKTDRTEGGTTMARKIIARIVRSITRQTFIPEAPRLTAEQTRRLFPASR
jgi:hypothetical protein